MEYVQPDGYLSIPNTGKGRAFLVLHAWWGLNDTIKDYCKRLSDQGFVAFAPDLYNGKLAETIEEAEILSDELDSQQAMSIISQSVDFLSKHPQAAGGKLGVIGFSLGAYFALKVSADEADRVNAVVICYGTGSADFGKSNAAYLGHFAENDPYEPAEYVEQLENELLSAGQEVTFYRYSGAGHWFLESDRPDAYNAELSQLAWERTISFLKVKLLAE